MTCTASYTYDNFDISCLKADEHAPPHHDSHTHWDWDLDDGNLMIVERRPYVCTYSLTSYQDGIIRVNLDQPSCPACEVSGEGDR